MTDRASRCVSHAFEFLKEVDYCSECRFSILGPDDCSAVLKDGSSQVKSSVSTSDLAKSKDTSTRQIHVCICPNRDSVPLTQVMNIVQENHVNRESLQILNGGHDSNDVGGGGDGGVVSVSESSTDPDASTSCGSSLPCQHSPDSAAASCRAARETETDGSCVEGADRAREDLAQSVSAGGAVAEAEGETIQLRRKSCGGKHRSVTTVVREAFQFLDTMDVTGDDNGGDEGSHVKVQARVALPGDSDGGEWGRDSTSTTTSTISTSSTSTVISTTTNSAALSSSSDNCQSLGNCSSLTLEESVTKTDSNGEMENGQTDRNVKEVSGERDKNGEEAYGQKNGVKEREDEDNTDVPMRSNTASNGVVLRRQRISRQTSINEQEEGDSDDSSDEECKVYNITFRNSTWVKVAGEDDSVSEVDISTASQNSQDASSLDQASTQNQGSGQEREKEEGKKREEEEEDTAGKDEKTTADEKLSLDPDQPRRPNFSHSVSNMSTGDEVFTEWPMTAGVQAGHKRSDSTSTTLSEVEFKRVYTSRSKCTVQRNDSQQEYHRLSAKFYDQEQVAVLEKEEGEADYGLHIIDSHPAIITTIQPGRAADRAGLKEGQILVSINGISVLESSHEEIVHLFQQLTGAVRLEVGNSDVVPLRDMQMSVMSGFLCKLGTATLVKMWKKRYFVLRNDHCLYYYKNEQEKVPLGAIPLSGYSISRFVDTHRDYCFKAEKYGARTYYFMAENRDDMTRWAGAMTEAAAKSKVKKSSFLEVSSHNVGLPALEIRRPECSGYLAKLGGSHRVWRRRYCVLKDACLYYFKSLNSLHAQGVVHFHGYKVDGCGVSSKKHSFSLIPPDTSLRTFHFTAENDTDKRRWVEALIRSIQRWVEIKDE